MKPKAPSSRLKIYTLGDFYLEKDGHMLTWTGKAPDKPLALLKVLIACGGEARESDLTKALWPDALNEAAHKALSVTLTRLRHLLGIDGLLEYRGGRVRVNRDRCWTDVWAFEELLRKVDHTTLYSQQKKLSTHAVGKLRRALELYRGPFLEDDQNDSWPIPYRARLHHKFIGLLLQLGGHWEQVRQWKQAVHCYQLGLDCDETNEALYHRWIMCLVKQGDMAEARRVYEQCTEILWRTKKREPGSELKKLTGRLSGQTRAKQS